MASRSSIPGIRRCVTCATNSAGRAIHPTHHHISQLSAEDRCLGYLGASELMPEGVSSDVAAKVVPRVGFEPTAYRLRSGCSTAELSGRRSRECKGGGPYIRGPVPSTAATALTR